MTSVSEASAELTRARHAEGMAAYGQDGLRIAREIGNRGPVRFDAGGRLHPDILAAYWKRYPDEQAYAYNPFAGREDGFRFNDATVDRVIRNYNLKDLAI